MLLLSLIKRLGDLGIRKEYLPWERYVTRVLNYMTLASISAPLTIVLIYIFFGKYELVEMHLVALTILPVIFILNVRLNYLWGLYSFFIIVAGFMFFFFQQLGNSSKTYLYIVPFVIGLLMLVNRPELKKHMAILTVLFVAFIGTYVFGYFHNWFIDRLPPATLTITRIINISCSSALTIALTLILIQQNLRQEHELKELIKQKETLLSEVHHRVKNNMAIISSLLNLRLEETNSDETREALEDTKNKIYSMALIHKKVYGGKTMQDVDFQEYVSELAGDLVGLYSRNRDIKLDVDARDCILQLDTAIPCGFIINELITNSCKYAYRHGKELELKVNMKHNGNHFDLTVTDNGPCFDFEILKVKNTLGMNLIDMLNKQLDATYSFRKDNGLVYEMKFMVA
jgi:two-component sensor histidine kinase